MSVSTIPALSALSAYRDLPAISGRTFLPISLFGRLPMAMTPVAILTFVAASTGDFTAAGLAGTATAAGTIAGAPAMGLLAERLGQRLVLGAAVLLNALALIMLASWTGAGWPERTAMCAVIGFSMPQVGGMARARWLALTRTRLVAAFAFEGTADELAFVLGPALAGLIASAAGPGGALLAAAALTLTAAGAFAVHPTHAVTRRSPVRIPGQHQAADEQSDGRLRSGRLLARIAGPVAAMAAMGVFFTAVQTALAAFAQAQGQPSAGGLLYALMAVGSAVTAALMPALPARIGMRARLLGSGIGLLAGVAALIAAVPAGTTLVAAGVLFAGLWVGPLLLTVNGVAAARVQPAQGGTAMAFLSAGLVCGIAAGAMISGVAAEHAGARGALLVAGAATVLLVLGAVTERNSHTDW